MEEHTKEPGLIELLLTVATEASDPQHPARDWAVQRYDHTINIGVGLISARPGRSGRSAPWTTTQIEREARGVFALMDGMQLQWLLNPSLPVAQMFKAQLDMTRIADPRAGSRGGRAPAAARRAAPAPGSDGRRGTAEGNRSPRSSRMSCALRRDRGVYATVR